MNRYIFAIGSAGGKPLEATKKDAASVYTFFIGDPACECHQRSPQPLLGCTSIDDFNREFNTLLRKWDVDDQLIFYYSGHGKKYKDKYCLVLGDHPVDLLSFESFMDHLETSNVEKSIIILDACASGQATKAEDEDSLEELVSVNPDISGADLPPGMAILTSSGPAQFSWENEHGDASIFTEVLLQILRNGIDNGMEYLFVNEVVKRVTETLRADPRYADKKQDPMLSLYGSNGTEIWLARNKACLQDNTSQLVTIDNNVFSPTDLELLAVEKLSEEHPSKAESLNDLDWDLVSAYRGVAKKDKLERQVNPPFSESELQSLALLSQVPVQNHRVPTRSAALCFCKSPERFHPEALTMYVDDTPTGDEYIRIEIRGPIIRQMDAIQELIEPKLDVFSYNDSKGYRQEREEVALDLFREVLANALIHRNFSMNGNVEVRLSKDYIEISNPGNLLNGQDFQTVLDSTFRSRPRNPWLMLFMNRLGKSEQIGRGFNVIRKHRGEFGDESVQCLEEGNPEEATTIVRIQRLRQSEDSASSGYQAESVSYYLDCLAEETASLSLMGMGRSLQVELPIAEAYVPLRTTLARSLEERATERFEKNHADHEEDIDLGDVFRKTAELGERGVVLLGEPGSGKTTGVRQLAWRLARRKSLSEDLGLPSGMTPVFLRLRNLTRAVLAKKNGLQVFLEDETRTEEAPDDKKSPGSYLWNGRAGGLLWILDGLDEVADPAARKTVSRWLRRALKNRPKDRFLVTCRFQGYFRDGVPLGSGFVEFHVRPLDDRQIDRFVMDWFAAASRKLLGPGSESKARAKADGNELLDILARPTHQTGHIRELCTNPLLLTILCIVFHEEKEIPTARAELYAHCVRVLLEYWRRDLYASDLGIELEPYDAEAAQAVLARVAWWMHQEQDRTSAPLDELSEEAGKGLAEVSPSSGLGRDGQAFLERMRDEAGILALEGEGRCGFLHLSFQEYLAAEHANREGLAQPLVSQATESWWREVALLSLRGLRPYCEAFFRHMLEAGIGENHPDLAARCLEESRFFVPGPFVEVLQSVGNVPDSRVAFVLRVLRERAEQVPELKAICRRLLQSDNQEIAGFAQEILLRLGVSDRARSETGTVLVDDRTGITLLTIPAGEFQMGSNSGDVHEKPIHRIRISGDFLMGKYPVTNAQFRRFLDAVGKTVKKPKHWDDRRFNKPDQPVVGVSWADAQAFCQWAECRLPTEAEWEYACRAGTTTEYCFSDNENELAEYGWFDGNSGGQTQPVGAKKANPWGLHDMHGNVWEWCGDWFDGDYYSICPESDPQGAAMGSLRVYRGGSWYRTPRLCRSAIRSSLTPSDRGHNLGFRVVRNS